MRILRALSRAVGVVLLIALALPLAWKLATGDIYVTVTGHSMEPLFHVGDVLVVQRPTGHETKHPGQIVVATFGNDADATSGTRYVHRVHSAAGNDRVWLKGDNNPVNDPVPVTQKQIVGTPRIALTGTAGIAFAAAQTIPGRAGLALGGLLLLLIPAVPQPRHRHARRPATASTMITGVTR